MFTITDLLNNVTAAVPYTYYRNEFPSTAVDNSGYVRINPGYRPDQWSTKRQPAVQIVVRGKNGVETERLAWELYNTYHQRRFYEIGTQHVSGSFADQSAPLYLGIDESNRVIYSVNFTLVLLAN